MNTINKNNNNILMSKVLKKPVKQTAKVAVKKTVVSAKIAVKKPIAKALSGFYAQIRSRHPTHNAVRNKIRLPFRTVIRFGSTTELEDTTDKGGGRIEINSVEAIKNSASKLRMKRCFTKNSVKTADWWTTRILNGNKFDHVCFYQNDIQKVNDNGISADKLPYPIVAKHHFGSRGNGNYLLNNQKELEAWMRGKDLSNYLFERFYNYVKEYRLHVSEERCFYSCRKMLKSDIPKEDRWFRNDSNSVWVLEENPLFDKPIVWDAIVSECIKALKATGLDFGACDVRVQSSKGEKGKPRKEVDFIIIEINSAPSFGDITAQKYLEELPRIAQLKKQK